MNPRTLKLEEVAEDLQIHPVTARELCANGTIAGAKKIGGQWRINRRRYEEWLEADEPPAVTLPPGKRPAMNGGRW